MMYVYIMRRTQIYLSDEEDRELERLSKETGRSKSQLIRTAVDDAYLRAGTDGRKMLAAIDGAAGSWKRRRETGRAYVDRLRRGRLAELHGQRGS